MSLEQLVTNTDFAKALKIGAVVAAVISPLMLIILVPAGLVGRWIGCWEPLRPYRWWISLALPLLLCALPVVDAIRARIDPKQGFERYFDVKAPAGARNFDSHVDNIILADLSATYWFECSKSETGRLIRELELHRSEQSAGSGVPTRGRWKATQSYDNHSDTRYTGFIELWTDDAMTYVCIRYWNT